MKNLFDLNISTRSYLISPSKVLQKHKTMLLTIGDFRKQLQYYNKHICSLSFYNNDGLYTFGYYNNTSGYGDVFFKALPGDVNFEIYLSERNKEIKRLQKLINKQIDYESKLKCLIENRAGDRRYNKYDLQIESNEWEAFMRNGGGTVPNQLLGNRDVINMIPKELSEQKVFNILLYNHIQNIISDPQKGHWLTQKKYNGFLAKPAIEIFAQQIENAIDKKQAILNEINRIDSKFRINANLDFYDQIYKYSIDDLELWQCGLLKASINGHKYDFSKRAFNETEMIDFVQIEQIFDYYKLLLDFKAGKNPLKQEIEFHTIPTDYNANDGWEITKQKCIQHNHTIYIQYELNFKNGKKALQNLVTKLLNATNNPLSLHEYEKLERQFNQVKSGFLLAIEEELEKGCIIDNEPNTAIEKIFTKLKMFQKNSLLAINEHLKTLDGLKKRDEKKVSEISSQIETQKQFNNQSITNTLNTDVYVTKQNELAHKFAPDGKYPVVQDGQHLMELLNVFYGQWMLFELISQQESFSGKLTRSSIVEQLKSMDNFISEANKIDYNEAMQVFVKLPFGGKERHEHIYYRLKHDFYKHSPIWNNALIFKGVMHDALTLKHHYDLIFVYGKYFLYYDYLKSLLSEQIETKLKQEIGKDAAPKIEANNDIKDNRYFLDSFVENREQNTFNYKNFNNAIAQKGFVESELSGEKARIYTAELATVFASENLEVTNMETNAQEKIRGDEYLVSFHDGYKDGQSHFDVKLAPSTSIIYSENIKQYVIDLQRKYFVLKQKDLGEPWNYIKTSYDIILTHKKIKVVGFYSGIVSRVDDLVLELSDQFKDFKNLKEIKLPQQSEANIEKKTQKKFIANEYALAYIFDLYAIGQQIPANRTEGGYNKIKIIEDGFDLYKLDKKKDTFYRAVKHVIKSDLNKQQELIYISRSWFEAVKALSKNWHKTEMYLREKRIIGE